MLKHPRLVAVAVARTDNRPSCVRVESDRFHDETIPLRGYSEQWRYVALRTAAGRKDLSVAYEGLHPSASRFGQSDYRHSTYPEQQYEICNENRPKFGKRLFICGGNDGPACQSLLTGGGADDIFDATAPMTAENERCLLQLEEEWQRMQAEERAKEMEEWARHPAREGMSYAFRVANGIH